LVKGVEVTFKNGEKKAYQFDNYVISAGVWSPNLCKMLNLRLPIQGFKGHSLDVYHKSSEDMLMATHILIPDQVAIVKMGMDKPMTRFTAFADLDGQNLDPIPVRKDALIKMAKKFYPHDYDDNLADHWVGLRPVTPDDCPLIGKSSVFSNLFYNCGHGSRGIALSLGSGKILSHILQNMEAPEGLSYPEFSP